VIATQPDEATGLLGGGDDAWTQLVTKGRNELCQRVTGNVDVGIVEANDIDRFVEFPRRAIAGSREAGVGSHLDDRARPAIGRAVVCDHHRVPSIREPFRTRLDELLGVIVDEDDADSVRADNGAAQSGFIEVECLCLYYCKRA
jgi:hypothetical protein